MIIFTSEMTMKWAAYGLYKSARPSDADDDKSTDERGWNGQKSVSGEDGKKSRKKIESNTSMNMVGQRQHVEHVSIKRGEASTSSKRRMGSGKNSRNSSNSNSNSNSHKGSEMKGIGYFQNGWNVLDCIIVAASWLSYGTEGSHYTGLRVLRVLKPLRTARTVTKLRPLRILIGTILRSFQSLADVSLLLLFFIVTFAIVGTQMFAGALHQQCFALPLSQIHHFDWRQNNTLWLPQTHFCPDVHPSRISSSCPSSYPYCLSIAPNPNRFFIYFEQRRYTQIAKKKKKKKKKKVNK
ncbi:hypothetical protein RFI_18080 [Reticulomyxa filosa]|uniref:Ion transport domain-containing protein n=1 Tax=Reticulomyxa filosa TaxID=46433 RepID=X6MZ95_RETFI|nr:hypothetical protein RFI_18080 [Reticulomyxa filosa]|eukprot:ETO19151.1 hypothetical protein RFI_18080 [Reticulomyxa filosa]